MTTKKVADCVNYVASNEKKKIRFLRLKHIRSHCKAALLQLFDMRYAYLLLSLKSV